MSDALDDAAAAGQPTGLSWKWLAAGAVVVTAVVGGMAYSNAADPDRFPAAGTASGADSAAAAPVASTRPAPAIVPATIVRGLVKPVRESTIASRMTAIITAMPFREGQSFGAGALLARFDCSQLQAELNAARAATAAYRVTHDTNVELDQYEAVGRNEVAVSAANLGRAQAEATAVAAQMSDCSVRAPFAGTVVERIANVREVAASGQPLLRIQSGRDVELELIVPSRWLTWLQPGATFAFVIDETGNSIRGRVTRFGASVDPVSRTIRVTSLVTERSGLVLPGMSGTATFDDPRARGGPAPSQAAVAPTDAAGAPARAPAAVSAGVAAADTPHP